VKVDLVTQIHDSGVKKHGMSITKSRPKEEMLKMESDGKYVWRKKGQVFLSEVMHKVEKNLRNAKQDFQKDNNNNANEKKENKTSPPSVAPVAMLPNDEMVVVWGKKLANQSSWEALKENGNWSYSTTQYGTI
jgi:hypothetical protein